MSNTLVYAFSSWGKSNSNISEDVLNKLDLPIDRVIFQVRFDKQAFRDLVKKGYKQIVGLGQYPSGNTIRIEQVAHNIFGSKSKGYHPIDEGPEQIATDLELTPTNNSALTFDAGRFVCNFSMYSILRSKRDNQKFAFLHIPKNMPRDLAVNYVEELLQQVL
ncbi:MAG: hypothetical protein E6R05_02370 [Candidatus Moraniibacteriota bacterium]|nr:MAG: hypothetical protein E6R05_02370 [Candidatus Moranbacteria bacterium]